MLPSFVRRGWGWLRNFYLCKNSKILSGALFQPPLNPLLEKGGDFWSISLKIKNRTQVYTKKKIEAWQYWLIRFLQTSIITNTT